MPRSARWVSGALGALFLALAGIVVVRDWPLTWRPAAGVALLLLLGLDLLMGALRGRSPRLAALLFLP